MKQSIMKGASILTVILMISMVFAQLVIAAPILPSTRWGNTSPAAAGEYVLAFVDGKQYGVSTVTDAAGLYSVEVMGDDLSDATVKIGGVDGETIQFVRATTTNGLTNADAGTFYSATQVFASGVTTNAGLTDLAGASPALLKVSAVATQSAWVAGSDWMRIYNPTGADVNIAGWTYDLAGTGGAIAITDALGGTVFPATSEIYVLAPGLANADSIQLIAPGGWVVDRVEYGAIGASASGETDMNNAVAPIAGQEIYRVGFADTNDCSADFAAQLETVDLVAPTAVPTPADGAIAVATATATYTITFSEPMQPVGTLATDDLPGGSWAWTTTTTYVKTGFTLAEVTAYDVILNTDFVDLFGNAVTGDITFVFTTADETAPTAIPTPADGATGVATATATYTITFSEPMQAVGTLATDDLPGGSWAWTTTTTYVKTGFTLADSTAYDVVLNTNFLDLAGNPVTGDITFVFTTGDSTAPTATPTPADNAVGVAVGTTTYTITFSEPMQAVGTLATDDLVGGSWAWTTTTTYVKTGFTVAYDGVYDVVLNTDFLDLAGNPVTGDITFVFTVESFVDVTPPTCVPTPADGAIDVAVGTTTYTITFNEPMQAVGTLATDDLVGGSWAWTTTTTYVKTGFTVAYDGVYDVVLNTDFLDLAGNPVTGDITFVFTVESFVDVTPPTCVPTPADGAIDVAVGTTTYTITFNEPMQAVGTLATDDLVGGSWAWATTTTYVKTGFTVAYDGVYDVVLNTDFLDLAGNPVTGDITFVFTVETDPGGGVVTSWDLYNGQNFRTFTSDLTAGWQASNLAQDVIAFINANYGEGLADVDVTVTKYDSTTGLYTTCYYWAAVMMWWSDFALVEGDTYIVEIASGALSTQPRSYDLPNFEITSALTIDLYNGQNFRGLPVTTATLASEVAIDVIAYINANYGEGLADVDVTVTKYDSTTGLYTTCYYWAAVMMWWSDFAITPGDGYIIEIASGALSTQPRAYTPS